MDIGEELRHARIARNLSLQDVSQRTKISTALLRAIEEDRFDRMPGGLFTRGYLRAYAREVRLDPETIVDQYRAVFEQPPIPIDQPPPQDWSSTAQDVLDEDSRSGNRTAAIVLVLLIGLGYFAFARNVATKSAAAETAPAASAMGDVSKAPAPIPTSGTVERPDAPLELKIHATGPCWVAATVDGARAMARLMAAGEEAELVVRDKADIRVGEPATFTFTIDGAPGRPVGAPGSPATFKINRQNYKAALVSKP